MPDITPPTLPDQPTPDINLGSAPVPAAPIAPLGNSFVPDPELANQARQQREATDRASQISAESTAPPPPGPHAKLAAMISGLMDGLGAASTSLATGGREGGAKEVAELQMQRKQQELEQQKYRDESKNQRVQQQIQLAQLHEANFNTINALQSVPDKLMLQHLQAEHEGQEVQKNAQDIFNSTTAVPDGWEVDPSTGQLARLGKVPAESRQPVATGAGSPWNTRLHMTLDTVGKTLQDKDGKEDPLVAHARAVVDSPTSTPPQKQQQILLVAQKANLNADMVKKLTDEADLAAKSTSAAVNDLKLQQDKLAQATFNRTVARNHAGEPVEDFATWQARSTKEAEVKAQQGDPTAIGALAADGLVTIPQVALARQLDKKGFQQLLAGADAEAKRNGAPEIVVNGRPTGHYFNANAATLQYDYVKAFNDPNSKSQQSINAGNTFMEHAADLLAVNDEYRRSNVAVLNTPLNAIAKKFGSATYTKFIASLAPVKTEYDNALKAGFAPTAEDAAAVDAILSTSATPAQIEAGTKAMVHTIVRRLDSTNQGYKTHTGVDYPNMISPNAAESLRKFGVDASGLQSGGGFSGTAQSVRAGQTAPSGKAVSLKAAMTLPAMKGKTEDQVRAEILAQGHQVGE